MYNKLTKIVKEEIAAYKNKKWIDFVDSLGKNPVSSRPFWQKINKMRNKNGKKRTNQMPSLELNNITYTSNEERANLFGGLLEQTFKDSNDDEFDKKFEIRIKNKV